MRRDVPAAEAAEVKVPCGVVRGAVPHRGVVVPGGRRGPIVDHRVQRHLEGDGNLATIASQQAEGGGKTTPGALAADDELVVGHAELGGVVTQPDERVMAVV